MGDNGETTTGGGPGGAPMNDEQRELETAQEAQEAQEKERRIMTSSPSSRAPRTKSTTWSRSWT